MSSVVPYRLLFRYALPVQRVPSLPRKGRKLLNLPQDCALPDLGELEDRLRFGEIRVAWNEHGLGIQAHVTGKSTPLSCDARHPVESDGLQVWIDTRNMQSVHRASRFCHHFCLLASGAGEGDKQPAAVQLPIARARENAPVSEPDDVPVAARRSKDGYTLEAWLPAAVLHGFDTEANPRLGFFYCLRDAELGEQFLTVGREFPFAYDPSLWVTLELAE